MTDWPVKTLGEVCDVSRGTSITRKQTKPGNIPVVAGGVDVAYFHSVNNRPAGTITVSSSGANAGYVNRWNSPIFASDCSTVEAIENGKVLGDYAFRYLQFKQGFINRELRRGAAQPHVYAKDIAAIEIPVPPLEEQKRIVALLDAATVRVTELSACYEQARTHANNLFTSALRDELEGNPDWPVKTLGDISEIYQPQTIGMKDLVPDGKYVVYGANGPIGRFDRFNHEYSEVTVTCRGATCGTVNVTPPEVWITGNAMVVRPGDAVMTKQMMRYVLEGLDYSSIITGAAQPQITRQTLAPSMIQVPPLEEQRRIVARLDSMRAKTSEMTAAYDAKLTAAKNLRQSILEAAFAGQL